MASAEELAALIARLDSLESSLKSEVSGRKQLQARLLATETGLRQAEAERNALNSELQAMQACIPNLIKPERIIGNQLDQVETLKAAAEK